MNKYEVVSKGTRYVRINKTGARNAYLKGTSVVLCPVKLSPFGPWPVEHIINRKNREKFCIDEVGVKNDFDNQVNSFEFHNCYLNETGYYCAYYIASN